MKNKLLFSSVCTATAALVACGGGGGNNTQTIAPTHPSGYSLYVGDIGTRQQLTRVNLPQPTT
jgi:hypothetical protein